MKNTFLIRGVVTCIMLMACIALIANASIRVGKMECLWAIAPIIICSAMIIYTDIINNISEESFNGRTIMTGVLNIVSCVVICSTAISLNRGEVMFSMLFLCVTTAILMFANNE